MLKKRIYSIFEDEIKLKERKSHHPSDANSCLRQLYYKWVCEPVSNPIDEAAIIKMRLGDAIHSEVFKWLKKSGVEIINEISGEHTEEYLKYPIRYRVDNLIINPDDNNLVEGVEIKTTYANGFKQIERENKPKEEHIVQCLLYIELTGYNTWNLLYIGRDNGYMLEYKLTKVNDKYYCDGEILEYSKSDLFKKFIDIEKHLEDKKLPEREFNVIIKDGKVVEKQQKDGVIYKSDWQCLYCQWLNKCWGIS